MKCYYLCGNILLIRITFSNYSFNLNISKKMFDKPSGSTWLGGKEPD